jgi:hypothetical protein
VAIVRQGSRTNGKGVLDGVIVSRTVIADA